MKVGQKIIFHVRYDGICDGWFHFRPMAHEVIINNIIIKTYDLKINKYIFEGESYYILLSYEGFFQSINADDHIIAGSIYHLATNKESLIDEILQNSSS